MSRQGWLDDGSVSRALHIERGHITICNDFEIAIVGTYSSVIPRLCCNQCTSNRPRRKAAGHQGVTADSAQARVISDNRREGISRNGNFR